jgi:hypothetical protein
MFPRIEVQNCVAPWLLTKHDDVRWRHEVNVDALALL